MKVRMEKSKPKPRWKETGRVKAVATLWEGGTLNDGPMYLAHFAVPERVATPDDMPAQVFDYPPVLIEDSQEAALGGTELEAIRALKQAAHASPLAKAVVAALRAHDAPERLTNEAQLEVEAFALAVERSARGTRFAAVGQAWRFIVEAANPARTLLGLIETENGAALLQLLVSLARHTTTTPDPSLHNGTLQRFVTTLKILADPSLFDNKLPRRKGRGTRATEAEIIAMVIMRWWRDYFGEQPDFAVQSKFMRVARPALLHFKIHKSDPEQFMRETKAKQGRLIPLPPAT